MTRRNWTERDEGEGRRRGLEYERGWDYVSDRVMARNWADAPDSRGRGSLRGAGGLGERGFGDGQYPYVADDHLPAGRAAGWDERVSYAGRGPRSYQRSDDRIEEDVNELLTENGAIDATHIQVEVQDGQVTLTGTVEDRFQKRLAEDIAMSARGAKDVHNRLRAQHPNQDR